MANIPMGEFGAARALPRAAGGMVDTSPLNVSGRGAGQIAEALGQGAQVANNIVSQQKAEAAKAAEEDKALKRVKVANAAASYELRVKQEAANVQADLSTGNATWGDAPEKFQTKLSTIVPDEVAGLDPVLTEQYHGAIAQTRQQAGMLLDTSVRAAKQDDGRAQYTSLIDKMGKLAGLPGADIEKINATVAGASASFQAFGLDPAVLAKGAQDFADRNWTNHALNRSNVVDNDLTGLQALKADLTEEKGMYATKLDADKRTAIARQVGNRIDAIESKALAHSDRLEAKQLQTLDRIDAQLASGFPATPQQRASWAEVFPAGSPMRAEYQARVEGEDDAQKFLRLPITEQLAGLRAEETKMRDPATGAGPHEQKNFARKKAIVEANVKMLTENGLQFASSYQATPIEPIDLAMLTDPAQSGKLASVLQARAATLGALRKRFGPQVKQNILQPEEVANLHAILDPLPAAGRLKALGHLAVLAPGEHYEAIMQQIAPDSPVTARAGQLDAIHRKFIPDRKDNAGISPNVALTMLRGEEQLNKGKNAKATDGKITPLPMPADKDFRAAFDGALGDVFASDIGAHDESLQWARAYYAGRMIETGTISSEIDENMVKDAVHATTGKVVDFNDRKVIAPFGMTDEEFDVISRVQIGVALEHLPPNQRRNAADAAQMVRLDDGVYSLVTGNGMLLDPNGRPIVIRVKK